MPRQYYALDEAIERVLDQRGPEALLDAKMVVSRLWRDMDPESEECLLVSRFCDATLLRPYADAMTDERESLHHAVVLACRYLVDAYIVPMYAELVADGIAKGIARWRGDDCSVPGGYYTLAELVVRLLTLRGSEVLATPDVVVAYALDYIEPSSSDAIVVERYANDRLLSPYAAVADTADGDELSVAAVKAFEYLSNECVVDQDAARAVADAIADGIAMWARNGWWDEEDDAHESEKAAVGEEHVGENVPVNAPKAPGVHQPESTQVSRSLSLGRKALPAIVALVMLLIVVGLVLVRPADPVYSRSGTYEATLIGETPANAIKGTPGPVNGVHEGEQTLSDSDDSKPVASGGESTDASEKAKDSQSSDKAVVFDGNGADGGKVPQTYNSILERQVR